MNSKSRSVLMSASFLCMLTFCANKPVSAPAPIVDDDPPPSHAGVLLDNGFNDLKHGDYARAVDHFNAALATGDLNDTGRILIYWQIHLAERELGHVDQCAEAATEFVVISQEVLMGVSPDAEDVIAQKDFIERFDLRKKLAQARATLSAIWMERVPEYGASEGFPIRVRSRQEIVYFLNLANVCQGDNHPKVDLQDTSSNTLHVVIKCSNGNPGHDYFFTGKVK